MAALVAQPIPKRHQSSHLNAEMNAPQLRKPSAKATTPSTGALEKTLHGARTVGADQLIELSNDLPPGGLGAEHDARTSGGNEQDGRERNSV